MKLYRFRIWYDENNNLVTDDDIYIQDIPDELLESFHKENEVYTLTTRLGEDVNTGDSNIHGNVMLILSDNKKNISFFVRGINLALFAEDILKINDTLNEHF